MSGTPRPAVALKEANKKGDRLRPPTSTDSWLRNNSLLFIPHRAHVVDGLVQPLAVIKYLDVIEDGGTCRITTEMPKAGRI